MRSEVEQLKEEKLKEAEAKSKYDSEKYIKDKLEEVRNKETGRLAKKMQESQKELFLERAKMTESIFENAANKLIEYTNTAAYKDSLIENAKAIAKLFDGNDFVLYVNAKDMDSAQKIKSLFDKNVEVTVDKTIKIGGMKGYCRAMNIVADETLDSKLYAQRDWFIENSQLSVL